MSEKIMDNIIIENAKIIFRNFSGKESRFNREGNRNFCVIIDDVKYAKTLLKDSWNVRTLAPRDEDGDEAYYLQVAVSFNYIPPKVILVTKNSKTPLDEELIDTLDFADIKTTDLVIRPYNWEVNGKTGVKAYLKTMYVTIEEDEFADKYSDNLCEDVPF